MNTPRVPEALDNYEPSGSVVKTSFYSLLLDFVSSDREFLGK